MNTEVAKSEPKKSVLISMADRYGMEAEAFELTVRATAMRPDKNGRVPSREEFAAFLLVAKEYKLNPLLKEIYAFPAKNGGIVPVVSIDGWVNLINSHPQFDGVEIEFEHHDEKLISCTCRIYRKDRSRPTIVTEYLHECIRNTEPWAMKHRMLRHKTLIQCGRYAFGFAGIYEQDEAERIEADVAGTITSAKPPVPPSSDGEKKAKQPAAETDVVDTDFETEEQIAEREAAEAEEAKRKQEAKDKRAAAKAEKDARERAEQEEASRKSAAQASGEENRDPSKEDKAARLSRLVMGVREIAAQTDVSFDSYLEAFDMMLKHADDKDVFLAMYAERRVPANADEKKRQMEMAEKHKQRLVGGSGGETEIKQAQTEEAKPKGWASKMNDAIDDFVRRSEAGDEDFNPDDIFDILDDVKEMEDSGRGDPEKIAALKNRLEEIVKSMG